MVCSVVANNSPALRRQTENRQSLSEPGPEPSEPLRPRVCLSALHLRPVPCLRATVPGCGHARPATPTRSSVPFWKPRVTCNCPGIQRSGPKEGGSPSPQRIAPLPRRGLTHLHGDPVVTGPFELSVTDNRARRRAGSPQRPVCWRVSGPRPQRVFTGGGRSSAWALGLWWEGHWTHFTDAVPELTCLHPWQLQTRGRSTRNVLQGNPVPWGVCLGRGDKGARDEGRRSFVDRPGWGHRP